MSDSLNFERLRKEAKTLLAQCRAGDRTAIDRMRAQLPRLAAVDNQQIAAQIKLAGVHHALAREQSYRSWADLKRHDDPVARFLAAIRSGGLKAAQDAVKRYPNLADLNVHSACALGDADAVRNHLEVRPGLVNAEQSGWAPLLYACASPFHGLSLRHAFGIHECAALLLDRGADPDAFSLTDPSDQNSRIPALARAAMTNNRLVLLLLVQRGATEVPGVVQALKRTFADQPANPLRHALHNLQSEPGYREELARRMAPFIRKRFPDAPLPQAGPFSFMAKMSIKEFMELEGDQGTARDGGVILWKLALERGLDPNLPSGPNGETTLHRLAMVKGDTREVAELFLAHGADPNVAAADGRTPYSIAVRSGNQTVADLLLAHGANANVVTPADELIGACRRADAEKARAILREHPGILDTIEAESHELLISAAKNNDLGVVRLMAELGFDLAAAGEGGATALHVAAWHGYVEMARLLVEFHAPVNIRDSIYRTSPLGWAAHGSKNNPYADDDNYCALVDEIISAGSEYGASIARSTAGLETFASSRVAALLKDRRFCR